MGYHRETMRYEFYHSDGKKVFVARTAKFLEDKFVLKGTTSKTMELIRLMMNHKQALDKLTTLFLNPSST